ncbi:MAG: CAP domain-containing protein [Bacteroidia bacterium]
MLIARKTIALCLMLLLLVGNDYGKSHMQTTSNAERISAHLHYVVNQYRASKGLVKLSRKSALDAIAQKHAEDVASGRVPFSHDGFKKRVEAVKGYVKFPYKAAENLYGIVRPPKVVAPNALKGWIDSPGHHVNLKGKFLYTGIGVARASNGEWIVCQFYVGKNA